MNPGRYHLVLIIDGQPVLHGWWQSEATARHKHTPLVGEQGRPGARITLADEEAGTVLTTWPEAP
ncbi:hypothetical protein ACF05F_32135 [Rhodococcus erythropolis]|jgi:prophage tail gpP-like protein|uniref:hypothetical protein n=1 Tax=Streptomyces sp. NPDC007904 TaxID=3364787 RepID=UPI0036F01252